MGRRGDEAGTLFSSPPSSNSIPKLFCFYLLLHLLFGLVDCKDIVKATYAHDVLHHATGDEPSDAQPVKSLERLEATSRLQPLHVVEVVVVAVLMLLLSGRGGRNINKKKEEVFFFFF
eukprot:GHVS01081049.1.p1 GENE.GHVS01081049.1~~GHVS01081049.1.p1  ORF type:complete len:118 (+),score=24.67 GHVS01081049.1:215-568(+)